MKYVPISLLAGTVMIVALTTSVAVSPAGSLDPAQSRTAPIAAPRLGHATDAAGAGAALAPPRGTAQPATHYPQSAGSRKPVPPAVALDPELAKPLPGDTAQTLDARRMLAGSDRAYEVANQLYDAAQADVAEAAAGLARAEDAATRAAARADRAHADFATVVTALYEGGGTPLGTQLLTADGTQDLLAELDLQQMVGRQTADVLSAARRTRAAAEAARRRVGQSQAVALAAEHRADAQLVAAAHALEAAQQAVAGLHAEDLAAAATARSRTLGGAAAAIEAQAIASRAATVRDFATAAGPAQIIAISTRSLLEQAAGRRGTPGRTTDGVPDYHPTHGAPVDEQAVMGPVPDLGATTPYAGTTGTGAVRALTTFDGEVSHAGWPSTGVGAALAGTAPALQGDKRAVHPALPAYRKGYVPLRAELAVDAALSELGSPYVWDAAGPDTFDCSGLTLWAWGHAGVALGHYTGDQVHEGRLVSANQLLPGDLVFFGAALHHVGMYLGAGYMIDAPTTGDYVKVQLVSDDGDYSVAVRP